ncbi:MAG: phosphoribosylformylglycinamidine synthase subunit PurS [Candidatus Omnitrophica bacterium]|nr:phosphoribosylformylglycinamidine synthase subunit PurS [Candidatus Omnitrophota bacterium]
MLEAEVYITLKNTLADPQGLTIRHALESLGYREVNDVRMGKLVTVRLNAKSKESAKRKLSEMCKKLLANPVIEDYRVKIRK